MISNHQYILVYRIFFIFIFYVVSSVDIYLSVMCNWLLINYGKKVDPMGVAAR
jgi:hypothetical protein